MLKLEIRINTQGDVVEFNLDRENITIGRRHDNDIRINGEYVSAYHAEFTRNTEGDYYLRDRDSLNGTFLNGAGIEDRVKISEGDTLNFGPLACRVVKRRDDASDLWDGSGQTATVNGFGDPFHQKDTELFKFERLNNASEKLAYQKRDIIALQKAVDSLELEQEEHLASIEKLSNLLNDTRDGLSFALNRTREQLDQANKLRTRVEIEHHTATEMLRELDSEFSKFRKQTSENQATLLKPHELRIKQLQEEVDELKSENSKLINDDKETQIHIDELEQKIRVRQEQSAFSRKGLFYDAAKPSTQEPDTEQSFCRELIDRLELLDNLMESCSRNWLYPKVSAQLDLLRNSFVALLEKHSVDQFNLLPGTQLTSDSRHKIQLIHVDELDDAKLKRSAEKVKESQITTVLHTVRPGYIYRKDGQDVIIRKAEVVVA